MVEENSKRYSVDHTKFLSKLTYHEIEKLNNMRSHFKDEHTEKREFLRTIECIIDNTVDLLNLEDAKKIL
jgi:hypothetical protein